MKRTATTRAIVHPDVRKETTVVEETTPLPRSPAMVSAYRDTYGGKPQPRQKCYACGGSGVYDHNGSPPCAGCNGTGYED